MKIGDAVRIKGQMPIITLVSTTASGAQLLYFNGAGILCHANVRKDVIEVIELYAHAVSGSVQRERNLCAEICEQNPDKTGEELAAILRSPS